MGDFKKEVHDRNTKLIGSSKTLSVKHIVSGDHNYRLSNVTIFSFGNEQSTPCIQMPVVKKVTMQPCVSCCILCSLIKGSADSLNQNIQYCMVISR